MRRNGILGAMVLLMITIMLVSTSCFGGASLAGDNSSGSSAPTVITPKPVVQSTVAATSGTAGGYYVTMDITVKNEGAEGTILVIANVTQAGKTATNEMPVFIKKGGTQELKMTFPLVWKGGDPTYTVQAVIP